MKSKKIDKAKRLVAQAEALKNSIAVKRDKLREITEELESVVDSLDRGVEDFEIAVDYFHQGLEQVSGLL